MAVDKEAISLSRVYLRFYVYLPLFYVYTALTRYLSILFLNILTLLACTHSSMNVNVLLSFYYDRANRELFLNNKNTIYIYNNRDN